MNKIINQYLILNFFKTIFNTILVFLALGILLNLFEEIEFFKNLDLPITLPLLLTLSYIPTLIVELLPFIIFISSMFYFLQLKSSKDLLSIKVFGYSNIKIISILSIFGFIFGCFVLFAINPITSTLIKYYESEKAQYAEDVDHLISINKNGVWIKEVDDLGQKIISAEKLEDNILNKVSIYSFNLDNDLLTRIEADYAVITNNPWQMKNISIYDFVNNKTTHLETYEFKTEKILDKINSLYRNLNTISFFDLIINYSQLNKMGYSKNILDEKINNFISLPFFLLLMVVLASIFTIGSLDVKQNFYYIIISIFISILIYYFKDLSIALGQTGKISLVMSVWMPVIAVCLFCLIGVIQINEK